jgi:hypothetical protein
MPLRQGSRSPRERRGPPPARAARVRALMSLHSTLPRVSPASLEGDSHTMSTPHLMTLSMTYLLRLPIYICIWASLKTQKVCMLGVNLISLHSVRKLSPSSVFLLLCHVSDLALPYSALKWKDSRSFPFSRLSTS